MRHFKAVRAKSLKPGIAILQSLNHTRCKFRAPPTSGLGMAIVSVTCIQKSGILHLMLKPYRFR